MHDDLTKHDNQTYFLQSGCYQARQSHRKLDYIINFKIANIMPYEDQ